MKSVTIVTIVLTVLVVLSAVQAFQLNSLKDKLQQEDVTLSTSDRSTPVAGSGDSGTGDSGQLPSNIQDLPQMVGGC